MKINIKDEEFGCYVRTMIFEKSMCTSNDADEKHNHVDKISV